MGSSPPSEVLPGERIGRYTVVRRLAVGGMAEVYLARHEGPKGFAKLVVIKRVLPGLQQTEKFIAMFLDEGRLAARLSHPNIAQAFELGDHDGSFHIVMEYVPGESLNRLVKRATLDKRPIPAGSVLRVAMQVLEALDYAHDLKGDRGEWLKVVHRDVSPTNVIITYHGGVKL
ncbi:MAG: Serine/threonine protein kinase, partial [Myxococcaceae bacterium]|nr:Serine/threonine protein kinase [Myxococcaceae bacterium]